MSKHLFRASARRSAVCCGVLLLAILSSGASTLALAPRQTAPSSSALRQAWSGTVTVTRTASGVMRSDDGKAALGFQGAETIVFQLGPDGTASYHSSFQNNTDFAGEYAVPTVGSGSGTTYYGLGFNGINWEVVVDGGDDIPTETNYTAQDQWWAEHFLGGLIALAEAVSGTPAPVYSGRVEKGGRGVNGVAFAAPGGRTAKTLSGSHTEKGPSSGSEGLEGPPTVPMTLTVSWNLTLGPVEPKVAIRGPDCGCLDAESPESSPLTFRAGTTIDGGEFSEFEVVPEGQAPEIVSNDGGEHPQLVLTGTRDTGAVTLKIHYTKGGRRYDAAPMRVEFCTLEDIQVKDDERDLAFDKGGALVVDAKAKAWHDGVEVSAEIAWDLEKMGSPTTLSSIPASARAEKIQFKYDGLPERNDSFGPRRLGASVVKGKCSCQRSRTIRTFFVGADRTHPGDDTPNWYYYWSQTPAITPSARSALAYQEKIVDANLPAAHPIAKYDPETGKLLVSRALFVEHGCRAAVDKATGDAGRRNEGIDCFAETVRHEWQHRQDAIDWWGTAAGPYGTSLVEWFAKDWDHDQVPNRVEDAESGCKSGSHPALTPSGGQETWFTCDARPFDDTTDAEIRAYSVGWTWSTGTVNNVDWVCGPLGKQWRGKACGK